MFPNEYSLFFLFLIPIALLVTTLRERTNVKRRQAYGLLTILTFIAVVPFVLFPETKGSDVRTVSDLLTQTGRTDIATDRPILLEVYSDY